ncbi:LON peptidase substrate-binding domain-containing protein [uncultured Dokdonia sp.]|uniref:LON peptidase substrate-binding domain-containing protein n=1 Tax=uncultured Dokdonia sp. TaxID=575653 RepID=UPI0026088DE8|nr:LON peptidase substrate-binding domain-containing protein [uncultured Dokdonia sp.]
MIATLPMFPLELVAFPGEELPLHIFEQRYQQLLEDCEEERVTFGIPTYINKRLEYGTEMELLKVVKRYPTGASDIICRGIRVFKLVDFYNRLDDRLYAGGTVQFFTAINDSTEALRKQFIQLLTSFYKELEIPTPVVNPQTITTYTLSHKMGLTIPQEYELLQIFSEKERYEYLIQHLNTILPTIRSVNRTKEIIKMNGHFKNFDPLDFEDY